MDKPSKGGAGRVKPKAGRESVWDYPRPPRLEACTKRIRVALGGKIIADTRRAVRVLETSHPPVYYIPPEDIRMKFLKDEAGSSFCEWKGQARYYIAFYAEKMDACTVDGERVRPQEGNFYGGWITGDIVGPFKGGPGSWGW
jgi:hypothetical protein